MFQNASEDFRRRNKKLFPDTQEKVELPSPRELKFFKQRQKYDSEAEYIVAESWIPRQQPHAWGYHQLCILLPGGRYTPDFWMIDNNGFFCIVEVKGVIRAKDGNRITHKSTRDARSKFRTAQAQWPWARFVWLEVEEGKVREK